MFKPNQQVFTTKTQVKRIAVVVPSYHAKGVRRNHNLGFTLIELLVVVLIVGILAAVAVPQYQRAVRKAAYAKMLPILRAVVAAKQVYYLENGTYPSSLSQLDLAVDTSEYIVAVDTQPAHGVKITLAKPMFGLTAHEAAVSGYEYVFTSYLTGIKANTTYCRENVFSAKKPRKDFHCTGRVIYNDVYFTWFEME